MGERTIKRSFRVTEEQNKYLLQMSEQCDMNISKYLRCLIEADKKGNLVQKRQKENFVKREIAQALSDTNYEINRIGNNLNQIAYHLNSGIYDSYEISSLKLLFEDIKNEVEKINLLFYRGTSHGDH